MPIGSEDRAVDLHHAATLAASAKLGASVHRPSGDDHDVGRGAVAGGGADPWDSINTGASPRPSLSGLSAVGSLAHQTSDAGLCGFTPRDDAPPPDSQTDEDGLAAAEAELDTAVLAAAAAAGVEVAPGGVGPFLCDGAADAALPAAREQDAAGQAAADRLVECLLHAGAPPSSSRATAGQRTVALLDAHCTENILPRNA